MKIFEIERTLGQWPDSAREAAVAGGVTLPDCLPVHLIADSAVVKPGKPVFIPDFAHGWHMEIVPVIGISRLGKTISTRFAPRYYSTVAVGARLVPPGDIPSDLARCFDGALSLSESIPFGENDDLTLCLDNDRETTISHADLHIEETIALVSRFATLKMGDLIIPCTCGLATEATIGDGLRCSLNGLTALELRMR